MNKSIIISFILQLLFLFAQSQTKIIDMHVHSYSQSDFGGREPARDHYGNEGAADAAAHLLATFAACKKWNIVKAVVSGNPESVENINIPLITRLLLSFATQFSTLSGLPLTTAFTMFHFLNATNVASRCAAASAAPSLP